MADGSEEFSPGERAILRNQRYMMLALSNPVRENTTTGSIYHAERLTHRVQDMERHWEWIAAPSERIAQR